MKFKEMSIKKKAEYIWDYYKVQIFLFLFVLYFLGSLVIHFVTNKEPILNVIMLNCAAEETNIENGFNEFFQEFGYEQYDGAIEVNSNLYVTGDVSTAREYENTQMLWALVASGEYDVFIGSKEILLEYADQGAFTDLSTSLNEDMYNRYKEQFIYSKDSNGTEGYPCVVRLKDNLWVKKMGYDEECCLGILYGGEHQNAAMDFLKFILSYE